MCSLCLHTLAMFGGKAFDWSLDAVVARLGEFAAVAALTASENVAGWDGGHLDRARKWVRYVDEVSLCSLCDYGLC